MGKSKSRTPPSTTRRRSLAASVDAVIARVEDILKETRSRLDRAGDLKAPMAAGISKLSEVNKTLRDAGLAADELRTLCALVDARDRSHPCVTESQTSEGWAQHPQAAGSPVG